MITTFGNCGSIDPIPNSSTIHYSGNRRRWTFWKIQLQVLQLLRRMPGRIMYQRQSASYRVSSDCRSSYYRLTEGLKSFWKSTGSTPEIRMNNISYHSFWLTEPFTLTSSSYSIVCCLLAALSYSRVMETSLLCEGTEIHFSHCYIRVCCIQVKAMSSQEDIAVSSDDDSPFFLCSSSSESEVSVLRTA